MLAHSYSPHADTINQPSATPASLRLVPGLLQTPPSYREDLLSDARLARLLRDYDKKRKPHILIVEHGPASTAHIQAELKQEFSLHYANTAKHALSTIKSIRPDLILADCYLPDTAGFELASMVKNDPNSETIPVILMAEGSIGEAEAHAFACGAVDFVSKPLVPLAVKARINNHLSLTDVRRLKASRQLIIRKLSRAAEFRDNETGSHFERMAAFARVLAMQLGLPEAAADDLANAAPMHDIGKIGIPDAILLKPGRLTPEEYRVMQQHPAIGASILHEESDDDVVLAMAYNIALTHHEKWDGSGYPNGLSGEDIPIEGRIVAIADVFDALTSTRPYKKPWAVKDATEYIIQQAGQHFDPRLINVFKDSVSEFVKIQKLT